MGGRTVGLGKQLQPTLAKVGGNPLNLRALTILWGEHCYMICMVALTPHLLPRCVTVAFTCTCNMVCPSFSVYIHTPTQSMYNTTSTCMYRGTGSVGSVYNVMYIPVHQILCMYMLEIPFSYALIPMETVIGVANRNTI